MRTISTLVVAIAVIGLIRIGAIDVKKTTEFVSKILVTALGGQPAETQYEFPVQSDRYAPASNQGVDQ